MRARSHLSRVRVCAYQLGYDELRIHLGSPGYRGVRQSRPAARESEAPIGSKALCQPLLSGGAIACCVASAIRRGQGGVFAYPSRYRRLLWMAYRLAQGECACKTVALAITFLHRISVSLSFVQNAIFRAQF